LIAFRSTRPIAPATDERMKTRKLIIIGDPLKTDARARARASETTLWSKTCIPQPRASLAADVAVYEARAARNEQRTMNERPDRR